MNPRIRQFQKALNQKRAVKIIAGIANFDVDHVLTVTRAATLARATAIDVAARPDIVQAVREATDLTVFASCINPRTLAEAVQNGADAVEIGNYDALYRDALFFTADEVLKIARETMALVGSSALVSVTLPGHLSTEVQRHLAKALEELGVDLLQTEGAARALAAEPRMKSLDPAQKADITLANTRLLAQEVRVPLMSASGITLANMLDAFSAGASAVGVGSHIHQLASQEDMHAAIERMMLKLAHRRPAETPAAPLPLPLRA